MAAIGPARRRCTCGNVDEDLQPGQAVRCLVCGDQVTYGAGGGIVAPERRTEPKGRPKVDGEIVGYRVWQFDGHRLTSTVAVHGGWEIGENTAVCKHGLMLTPLARGMLGAGAAGPAGAHEAPHRECQCVPLDTEILTQRGWLTHDEVRVGDRTLGINPVTRHTEWTAITAIHHREPEPLLRVGNDYWSVRATPDHRWPVWEAGQQHFVTTANLPGSRGTFSRDPAVEDREIVTKAPYVGGASSITPAEAALIAWMYTDGHLSRQTITQKKPVGLAALKQLLRDVPHTVGVYGGVHSFRLRTPYFTALWEKAGLPATPLTRFVMTLTRPALEAFMEAAWLAEGGRNGSCRTLTQNAGDTADALALGVYLLGFRPRVHVHDSASSFSRRRGVCRRITYCDSRIRGQRLTREALAPEPTWCVTTKLGTWTMRQDEQILPTGNCGLYALHNPPTDPGGGGLFLGPSGPSAVYGAVLAWGRVQVHSDGFRAQHARPVVLAYSPNQPYDHVCKLKAMASEFDIECVELDHLEEAAAKHGQPVAKELRPKPTPKSDHLTYSGGLVYIAAGSYAAFSPVATGVARGGRVGGATAPPPPPAASRIAVAPNVVKLLPSRGDWLRKRRAQNLRQAALCGPVGAVAVLLDLLIGGPVWAYVYGGAFGWALPALGFAHVYRKRLEKWKREQAG